MLPDQLHAWEHEGARRWRKKSARVVASLTLSSRWSIVLLMYERVTGSQGTE